MIVVVGAIVLMVGADRCSCANRSSGKAMRATSFDREAAAMMGIDVDRVIVATFFIGSALAGAAGVFNGLVYQQVWPYMGFQAGLNAFIAAVVGGIGNLPGAVARRARDRARRVVLDRLHLLDLQRRDRLRGPDRGHGRRGRAACSDGRRCRRYE